MTYPMVAIIPQRARSRKPTTERTSQTTSMTSYKIKKTIKRQKISEKPQEKITYNEKITDNRGEFLKSATKDDVSFNNQIQIVEETLEESNDFREEGDDESVIDIIGTTFNCDSSV